MKVSVGKDDAIRILLIKYIFIYTRSESTVKRRLECGVEGVCLTASQTFQWRKIIVPEGDFVSRIVDASHLLADVVVS